MLLLLLLFITLDLGFVGKQADEGLGFTLFRTLLMGGGVTEDALLGCRPARLDDVWPTWWLPRRLADEALALSRW